MATATRTTVLKTAIATYPHTQSKLHLPSQYLAQKLGYIPESTYEWLVLPA